MELDHASHPDHKLSYRKSVKSDEKVEDCAACTDEISSEHYCCVECNFFLHKLCAERPQEISHSLHPLHPLHLYHKSPYEALGNAQCNACMKIIQGFIYHCAICKFDLDLICAFPDGLKLNHLSHPEHVLTFEKGVKPSEKGLVCVLYSHHISGQSAELYSCRRCNVFLHKVCPEVPLELTHSSHIHPLQLIPWNPYSNEYARCRACYDVLNGALYHCNLCKFTLHLTCADPTLKPDYNAFPGTRKLNHVCHPHILTLENEVKGSNKGLICAACLEGISGPLADYYSCRQCNFFLHKLCSERPLELVHSFHPQHTLNLIIKGTSPCDFCQKPFKGFSYHCQHCKNFNLDFNLDFKCAFPKPERQILEHVHPHPLIFFPRDSKISCDLCSSAAGDERVEEQSYACLTCDFMIHKSCAVTELTQRYTKHKHPLSLVQGVTEDLQIYSTFFCDVCHNRISQEASVAHCALCRYFVHVSCMITGETDPIITIKDDVDYLDGSVIQFLLNGGEIVDWTQSDVSLELIQPFLLNKNGIVIDAQPKIRHFSHKEHDMILFEELHVNNDSFFKEEDEEILCDACIHPVTAPYYCCQDCNYYLHLPCANLPSKISHFSHDHELDLSYDLGCYNTFRCDCCNRDCNGFAYWCKICKFSLDLTCAALPVAIAHESHEHLLIQSRERTFGLCHCCQKDSFWDGFKTIFKCQYCEVYLHYRCAMLTRSIRHRWDRQHPLDLRYPPHADHPDHIMCDMCEELVHPMRLLYSCFQCKVSFHTTCALKYQKFSNMKCGGKVKIWSHPHILKHLKKATLKITCDMCGEALDSCDVFECETCYDCICRDCVAAEASSLSESSGEENREEA